MKQSAKSILPFYIIGLAIIMIAFFSPQVTGATAWWVYMIGNGIMLLPIWGYYIPSEEIKKEEG